MSYVCPRCAHHFSQKSNFMAHIHKKKLCKLVDLDIEPVMYKDVITRIPGSELDLLRKYIRQQNEIQELQNKLRKKDKELEKIKEPIYYTSKICPYNEYDISHLKDIDFKASLNRMIMCIPELVKRSHFNKYYPEYHNIYITNLRNNCITAYDGKQWNVYNKYRLLDEIIRIKELSIIDWLSSIAEDSETYEKYYKKYQTYEKLKDQESVKQQIIEELEFQLFNYKHLAQENHKNI